MKQLSLVLILHFANLSFSQDKVPDSHVISQIINEVQISGNISTNFNSSAIGRVGGGIGIYHEFLFKPKFLTLICGLEYNYNRQFLKHLRSHGISIFHNIDVSIHNATIPFSLRFKIGKKVRFLCEIGAHLDLYSTSFSNENHKNTKLESGINGGPQGSIGIQIPLKNSLKLNLFLCYRYGVRYLMENAKGGNYHFQNHYIKLGVGLNWARKYEPEVK